MDEITNERLEELEALTGYFTDRHARAKSRLAEFDSLGDHFAIVGLKTSIKHFDFDYFAQLREVHEPPGVVEIATAAKSPVAMCSVGHFSAGIGHELVITSATFEEPRLRRSIAHWIVSAIRIRTLAEFIIPAVSERSWSVISAIADRKCEILPLENFPHSRPIARPVAVSEEDLEWVTANVRRYGGLRSNPSFSMASDALTRHLHLSDPRMMVASLWAGLEALFGLQSELRFRLALSIATLIESRGGSRTKAYREIKKLYDSRSKAVHGGDVLQDELESIVVATRQVLSKVLCTIIEEGSVPSADEVERRLLE